MRVRGACEGKRARGRRATCAWEAGYVRVGGGKRGVQVELKPQRQSGCIWERKTADATCTWGSRVSRRAVASTECKRGAPALGGGGGHRRSLCATICQGGSGEASCRRGWRRFPPTHIWMHRPAGNHRPDATAACCTRSPPLGHSAPMAVEASGGERDARRLEVGASEGEGRRVRGAGQLHRWGAHYRRSPRPLPAPATRGPPPLPAAAASSAAAAANPTQVRRPAPAALAAGRWHRLPPSQRRVTQPSRGTTRTRRTRRRTSPAARVRVMVRAGVRAGVVSLRQQD